MGIGLRVSLRVRSRVRVRVKAREGMREEDKTQTTRLLGAYIPVIH